MSSCCHHKHHPPFPCDGPFEGPSHFVRSIPHNGQTRVDPDIKSVKLIFDRDFHDDGFLDIGHTEIDMWRGSLSDCSGSHRVAIKIREGRTHFGRRVLLVIPLHPLRGGTLYKVRIKSVFVDNHGVVTKKFSLITFTTACR